MSGSSTQFKVIVTVAGSYVATVLNFVTSYVALSVLGPQSIGLYQTFLLIKNYALYSNLGEVQSIRKQGPVLWARGEHAEVRRYQDQTLTVALLSISVAALQIAVVGMIT